MNKKHILSKSREVYDQGGSTTETSEVVFRAGNWLDDSSEMIRITPDGFWVRGVKVQQDAREAQHVYDAFKEWLVYSSLSRDH